MSTQSQSQPQLNTPSNHPQPTPPKTGTFTLLLFASAQSYCSGTESLVIPAPTTLAELLAHLESKWPGVREKVLQSSQFVVNLEYVDETRPGDVRIMDGDEVAVVPPVSAG